MHLYQRGPEMINICSVLSLKALEINSPGWGSLSGSRKWRQSHWSGKWSAAMSWEALIHRWRIAASPEHLQPLLWGHWTCSCQHCGQPEQKRSGREQSRCRSHPWPHCHRSAAESKRQSPSQSLSQWICSQRCRSGQWCHASPLLGVWTGWTTPSRCPSLCALPASWCYSAWKHRTQTFESKQRSCQEFKLNWVCFYYLI